MDQDFRDAFFQEEVGWPGLRALMMEWLLYATTREARSMLRIHRSPQLRRILTAFLTNEMVSKNYFYKLKTILTSIGRLKNFF